MYVGLVTTLIMWDIDNNYRTSQWWICMWPERIKRKLLSFFSVATASEYNYVLVKEEQYQKATAEYVTNLSYSEDASINDAIDPKAVVTIVHDS